METEKVVDHYNGNVIVRPLAALPGQTLRKYDFDFRPKGSKEPWRYLNSFDDPLSDVVRKQVQTCEIIEYG